MGGCVVVRWRLCFTRRCRWTVLSLWELGRGIPCVLEVSLFRVPSLGWTRLLDLFCVYHYWISVIPLSMPAIVVYHIPPVMHWKSCIYETYIPLTSLPSPMLCAEVLESGDSVPLWRIAGQELEPWGGTETRPDIVGEARDKGRVEEQRRVPLSTPLSWSRISRNL